MSSNTDKRSIAMSARSRLSLEYILCAVNIAYVADIAPRMETSNTATLMPATQQSTITVVEDQIHQPNAAAAGGNGDNNGSAAMSDARSSMAGQAQSAAPPPVPSAAEEQTTQPSMAGPANGSTSHCQEQSRNKTMPVPAADSSPIDAADRPSTESPTKLPRKPLPDAPARRSHTDPASPPSSSSFLCQVLNRDPGPDSGMPSLPPPSTSMAQQQQPPLHNQQHQPQQQQQPPQPQLPQLTQLQQGQPQQRNRTTTGTVNSRGLPFGQSTIQELQAARKIREEGQLQPVAKECHNCHEVRKRRARLGALYKGTDKEKEFFIQPGGCVKIDPDATTKKQRATCALCTAKKECCQSPEQKVQRDADKARRRREAKRNAAATLGPAPGPASAPAPGPAPAPAPANGPRPRRQHGGGN